MTRTPGFYAERRIRKHVRRIMRIGCFRWSRLNATWHYLAGDVRARQVESRGLR